jgi:hypothetical protein
MRNGRVCEGAQNVEAGGGILTELFKRVRAYGGEVIVI